eukprot:gene10890-biopygen10916
MMSALYTAWSMAHVCPTVSPLLSHVRAPHAAVSFATSHDRFSKPADTSNVVSVSFSSPRNRAVDPLPVGISARPASHGAVT